MVSYPSQYTAMAWHQSRNADRSTDPESDGWWRPEAWYRAEFNEPARAKAARDMLDSYLLDTPAALAHIGYMVGMYYTRPAGRAADRPPGRAELVSSDKGRAAVVAVATWLDEILYGQGREQFPKEERYPLQVTADSMARGDFCRMDFGELVADCLAVEVEPAPISAPRSRRTAGMDAQRMA